ncbi:MAG: serine hydrolase [Candidatus Tectomicrobia bacterium]|uniref:Serine hydrolase n=1 Tax=Tectimicrobiota bacterium TaxID=2528274 RepID=A0A932G0A1_UNCTE|nr:serine hydrolase [Candidatus Tectomicrobia bacterium]
MQEKMPDRSGEDPLGGRGTKPLAMRRVHEAMEEAIVEGVFPGAVLLVAFEGEVLFHRAYGQRQVLPQPLPMILDTRFDLASLTKAVATSLAAMLLVQGGHLSLEDRIHPFLSVWGAARAGEAWTGITLRHLLSHSTGLPAWQPYYLEIEKRGWLGNPREARRQAIRWIVEEPRLFPPGTRSLYSDLGFILLGAWLEEVAGQTQDHFCQERIFRPLGLSHTGFRPLYWSLGHPPHRAQGSPSPTFSQVALRLGPPPGPSSPLFFAATEDCPWRKRILCGEVHDENAHALGGVAGHAGLFSTAGEVYQLAETLRRAYRGEAGGPFIPQVVQTFFTRQVLGSPGGEVTEGSFALGWDTPVPQGSSAGRHFSPRSVGHLGYTGTSLWMDLDRGLIVILLTNRVHPSRSNEAIKRFRPKIHDLISLEVSGG